MALNVYKARETIEWANPVSYFGWHISDTGWSGSVHHFETEAKREAYRLAVVTGAGFESDDYDGTKLAALLLYERFSAEHEPDLSMIYDERYTQEQIRLANAAADAFLMGGDQARPS